MKIYVAHSRAFDFENELYAPLRASSFAKDHEFIFPHAGAPSNSKDAIKDADLVLAEVSFSSTGEGIELGWADMMNKRIVCLYKNGMKISGSLNYLNIQKIEYSDTSDLIEKLAVVFTDHDRN